MGYKYVQAQAEQRDIEEARRLKLISDLGAGDDYMIGAVLRWTRKLSNRDYSYAALKTGDGKWYVTGSTMVSAQGWTWESLVEWMTSGDTMVENVEVSESWRVIATW